MCVRALCTCLICMDRVRHHEYHSPHIVCLTGAIAIADALEKKTELTILDIGQNNITTEGGMSRWGRGRGLLFYVCVLWVNV